MECPFDLGRVVVTARGVFAALRCVDSRVARDVSSRDRESNVGCGEQRGPAGDDYSKKGPIDETAPEPGAYR
jgi:hypothetical protein